MTPFLIEHEFRSPDIATYWRGYFDPAHQARLDAAVGISSRELVVSRDEGDTLYREIHMVPERHLPGWLRKVTRADLDYMEISTFYKNDNRLEIAIKPSLFPKRTRLEAVYTVIEVAPGRLLRRFEGEIEVSVALVGRRVERGVVEDMKKSYELAVPITQALLDEAPGAG